MKLRIARISSNRRMAGEFIIQKRFLFFWWRMSLDITDGSFDDYHEALKIAHEAMHSDKPRVLETWPV